MNVIVAWTNTLSGITGLEVWRLSNENFSDWVLKTTLAANASTWTDLAPVAGMSNSYKVRGVNGATFSAWSPVASATVPLITGAITNITAVLG